MSLGGSSADGTCGATCDFWCTENWRVGTDPNGCEVWLFDYRAPAPDEDSFCQAAQDGGSAPVPRCPGATQTVMSAMSIGAVCIIMISGEAGAVLLAISRASLKVLAVS